MKLTQIFESLLKDLQRRSTDMRTEKAQSRTKVFVYYFTKAIRERDEQVMRMTKASDIKKYLQETL